MCAARRPPPAPPNGQGDTHVCSAAQTAEGMEQAEHAAQSGYTQRFNMIVYSTASVHVHFPGPIKMIYLDIVEVL